MPLTSYSDPATIQALIDYRLNGLSGVKAASLHGLPHRNTVYRANAHYKIIKDKILDIIPALGFNLLFAKVNGTIGKPKEVRISPDGLWSFPDSDGSYETACLEFFVKLGDRFEQL
ncbi:TPA: hypothetical protein RQO57_003592 [Aeromonas dhakensis]|uniref:hypothetical protein n=1 Tax=Aeromonas dhakensis TaxID=196024 RepID=UPI002892886A|nr:hypothetical protein [Aeromonas dhakensis]